MNYYSICDIYSHISISLAEGIELTTMRQTTCTNYHLHPLGHCLGGQSGSEIWEA